MGWNAALLDNNQPYGIKNETANHIQKRRNLPR